MTTVSFSPMPYAKSLLWFPSGNMWQRLHNYSFFMGWGCQPHACPTLQMLKIITIMVCANRSCLHRHAELSFNRYICCKHLKTNWSVQTLISTDTGRKKEHIHWLKCVYVPIPNDRIRYAYSHCSVLAIYLIFWTVIT
jgi:hypothetical protein